MGLEIFKVSDDFKYYRLSDLIQHALNGFVFSAALVVREAGEVKGNGHGWITASRAIMPKMWKRADAAYFRMTHISDISI